MRGLLDLVSGLWDLVRGLGELVKASVHLKELLVFVLEEGFGIDWAGARGLPVWVVEIGKVVENAQL